jgi:hypothetical protein
LAERFHVRGGIEPGFLTASRNRQKAVAWARSVKGSAPDGFKEYGLLFEIEQVRSSFLFSCNFQFCFHLCSLTAEGGGVGPVG